MYLIRKAVRNLFHNKGRNFLLFLLLVTVTLAAVASLTIYNLTMQVKKKTENYYAGEVAIVTEEGAQPDPGPSMAEYKKYADSDYLRSYVIYRSLHVKLENLTVLDGDFVLPENSGVRRMTDANANVLSLLDERSTDDFSYGDRKMAEGRFPAGADEAIVSVELAELNDLRVGDTIRFTTPHTRTKIALRISGIFSDETVARSNSDFYAPQFNRRNDVIAGYGALDGITDMLREYKTFLLRDSADLEAFQQELYEKGLATNLRLRYGTDRYNEAVEGTEEMLGIVTRFFGIVAVIGVGVVFLINALALRERKYEIGVLRAIGMSKGKIMLLLLAEMFMLALIGSAVALLAGLFVNPLAVDEMKSVVLGGQLPSALIAEILGLGASLSGIVVLEVLALSAVLALIAGSVTVAGIMRFDPVKILSERS